MRRAIDDRAAVAVGRRRAGRRSRCRTAAAAGVARVDLRLHAAGAPRPPLRRRDHGRDVRGRARPRRRAGRPLHRRRQPGPQRGLRADRLPPGRRPPGGAVPVRELDNCGADGLGSDGCGATVLPGVRAGDSRQVGTSDDRTRPDPATPAAVDVLRRGCLATSSSRRRKPPAPSTSAPSARTRRASSASDVTTRAPSAPRASSSATISSSAASRPRRRGDERPRRARRAAARRRRARRSPARRRPPRSASSCATSRRVAPARSRHQPSGREPMTLEASTTQRQLARSRSS